MPIGNSERHRKNGVAIIIKEGILYFHHVSTTNYDDTYTKKLTKCKVIHQQLTNSRMTLNNSKAVSSRFSIVLKNM